MVDGSLMPRCVAFLRAINVGGHVVKMDRLRELFESLKLRNVETFIASGNVIFDCAKGETSRLEQRIERALEEELGYEVATFIRSTSALPGIVTAHPFAAAKDFDRCVLSIGFLKTSPANEARERLLQMATATDEFHVDDRQVYWLCRTKTSDSRFSGAFFEKALGARSTFRNVTTVHKLAEKYG